MRGYSSSMERVYLIKGTHPADGRAVELTLRAAEELDARSRAEDMGLENIVMTQLSEGVGATGSIAPGLGTAGEPRPTPTVLIVEDHEDTRSVLVHLMELDGYVAMGAEGGVEALAMMREKLPSLVITDFNMPGMDGVALIEEIRRDAGLGKVPVILFSAALGDLQVKAMRAGADAFVTKHSMDWADLQREMVRLVGPGSKEKGLPGARKIREKEAG